MMKRRKFLKTAGAVSVVLSAGTLYAYNYLPNKEVKMYPPDELKAALEKHFNEIFSGKNFNPDVLPPNGKMMIPRSYSIEIIEQKNTIFDIADIVIERLKKSGFDAGSLKNGKIPDDLMVGNGIIQLPNNSFPVKINELKNYDASILLAHNLSLATNIVPKDWIKLTELNKEEYPNGVTIFQSEVGNNYFNLSGRKNSERTINFRFNVDELNPVVKITDFLPYIISFDFFSNFLTEEQAKQFKL